MPMPWAAPTREASVRGNDFHCLAFGLLHALAVAPSPWMLTPTLRSLAVAGDSAGPDAPNVTEELIFVLALR